GLGLGAAQAEHEVGALRVAGPDLLAVDHPLVAHQLGAGPERGEVASGAGLAVALTPEHLAEHRLRDPLLLLPFFAALEQGRNQHHGADGAGVAPRARARKLLADHLRGERVGGLLRAAVAPRDRAREVARLDRAQPEAPRLARARAAGLL